MFCIRTWLQFLEGISTYIFYLRDEVYLWGMC